MQRAQRYAKHAPRKCLTNPRTNRTRLSMLQNHGKPTTQSNNARHPNRSRHSSRGAPHIDLLARKLESRIVNCRRTIRLAVPAVLLHALLAYLRNICPSPGETSAQDRTANARRPIRIDRAAALTSCCVAIADDS